MERGGEAARRKQLVVTHEGRKPLFASKMSGDGEALRRTKSESQTVHPRRRYSSSNSSVGPSPAGTRIPRPNSSAAAHRCRPMSLAEAYKLAEDEEMQAAAGSSSPAPQQSAAASGRPEPGRRRSPERTKGSIPDLVPGIEDVQLPSVEVAGRPWWPSPQRKADGSPEKSFAWQVDDDFTAGDVQVSDSPRIGVGSNQPFASRPSLVGDRAPATSPARPTQPGNSRLNEIRAREKAVDHMAVPGQRPKNTKLDEIRQREAQGLSKRAYAAVRLEEIRERNSVSRSLSPEEVRPPASWEQQARAMPGGEQVGPPRSAPGSGGERIPDTPVTVFKKCRPSTDGGGTKAAESGETASDRGSTKGEAPANKRDSYDLLRRLARATSASPAAERGQPSSRSKPNGTKADGDDRRAASKSTTSTTAASTAAASTAASSGDAPRKTAKAKEGDGPRPIVGFAGMRRVPSVDSAKSKRSSAHSEMDPTDRIEAEMKLFAPHENHSEPGSVRAPSPPDSDPGSGSGSAAGKTPKPREHEFLSMPTPRVTGAYVETPATGLARRSRDQDTALDPGTSDSRDGDAVAAAAAVRRRRARSLPLRNSAKLPSVRDDLLELQRMHNIDDSTMDDLEELLTGRRAGLRKRAPAAGGDDEEAKDEQGEKTASSGASEGELALFDRMNRSLRTGILGIRSAKEGIERLEDQFRDGDDKDGDDGHRDGDDAQLCQACRRAPAAVTYVHLPLPRLFYKAPRFRLSLLGVLALALTLWLAAESAVCAGFCRPAACGAGGCVFSFDDPTFGSALPVKLDEWATGGRGRWLAAWAADEARDRAADARDWVRGRGASDGPGRATSFEQRQRRRRRLAREAGAEPAPEPPAEHRDKWAAWRRARRAREARYIGYGGEAVVGGDERVA